MKKYDEKNLDKNKMLFQLSIEEFLELINPDEVKHRQNEDVNMYSVKTLSKYLLISEVSIRKNLSKLPHIRINRRILFRKEAIDAWLDDNASESYSEFKMRLNQRIKSKS